MTTTTWTAGAAALAASPILASWTLTLPNASGRWTWWRPARTPALRWALATVLAVALTLIAAPLNPWPAWWLFAAGGTVLIVTDLEHRLLPARLAYPLTGAILIAAVVASAHTANWAAFARGAEAAALVGAIWAIAWIVKPAAIGRGDLRLQPLCAGLAGYQSWTTVLVGQLAIAVTSLAIGMIVSNRDRRASGIPMGPGLIIGTLLAALLAPG